MPSNASALRVSSSSVRQHPQRRDRRTRRQGQRKRPWHPLYSWIVALLLFVVLILYPPPLPKGIDTGGGLRFGSTWNGDPSSDHSTTGHLSIETTDAREADKHLIRDEVVVPSIVESVSDPVPVPAPVVVECTLTTPNAELPAADTANGRLRITVRPDLAPQSSAAFIRLVSSQYYDGVFIFRVIKGFIAQFGIHPNWNGVKPQKKKDGAPDPVLPGKSLSNVRGTLSFAGGNIGTGQVFINLGNNARLDAEGGDDGSTRPFATVDLEGMAIADKLYTGYKEGQGQVKIIKDGGDEARAIKFPNMSRIEICRLV